MSNIINFSAVLDERRAAAALKARAAADAAKFERERADLAERLGGSPAAQVVAAVVAELSQQEAERERAARPMPAYCNPSNETRGEKYDATKGLSCVEIAKRIRQDLKEAQARGDIPAGCKFSVRSDHNSIDLRVMGLPDGFRYFQPEFLRWERDRPHELFRDERRSPELCDLMDKLSAIHGAYNRDNSDSMSDYFDVRYYGHAELDWQVRDEAKRRETAALDQGGVSHDR